MRLFKIDADDGDGKQLIILMMHGLSNHDISNMFEPVVSIFFVSLNGLCRLGSTSGGSYCK